MANEYYSTLYSMNFGLLINGDFNYISPGDVVSFLMENDYDKKTYPIIRLRLYSDLTLIQALAAYPDDIELSASIIGGIYKMSTDKSPSMVRPTTGFTFSSKVYLEYKNIPTSVMDRFENGLPRSQNEDLNTENKVPIELYCYDKDLIHRMKDQPQSIYKNMSLPSIITSMLDYCKIRYNIDPIRNSKKYDQILIPNLNMIDSLSFFDTTIGLYPKGAGIFGFNNILRIYDLDSNNGNTPIPIYVNSYNNDSDMGGMKKINEQYFLETKYDNVSVITESDIAKVLNAEIIESINVINMFSKEMTTFDNGENISNYAVSLIKDYLSTHTNYSDSNYKIDFYKYAASSFKDYGLISNDYILHKYLSEYVTDRIIARLNEQITKVDISGVGFNVEQFDPTTRFNLIFESPIRGIKMADVYRPSFIINIFNSVGNNLFCASTTMRLCKN